MYQVSAVYAGSCGGSAAADLTVARADQHHADQHQHDDDHHHPTTTTTTVAGADASPTTTNTVAPANAAPTTEQAIAPATELPATGDGNGSVAIFALVVFGLGAMLLATARHARAI